MKKKRTWHVKDAKNGKRTWWEISGASSVSDGWGACIIANYKDQKGQNEGKNQRERHKKKKIKRKEREISEGIESNKDWTTKESSNSWRPLFLPWKLFYIICGIFDVIPHRILFILELLRHFFYLNFNIKTLECTEYFYCQFQLLKNVRCLFLIAILMQNI